MVAIKHDLVSYNIVTDFLVALPVERLGHRLAVLLTTAWQVVELADLVRAVNGDQLIALDDDRFDREAKRRLSQRTIPWPSDRASRLISRASASGGASPP